MVFPWHNLVNLKPVLVNEIGFLARISVREEYQVLEANQVELYRLLGCFFAHMSIGSSCTIYKNKLHPFVEGDLLSLPKLS